MSAHMETTPLRRSSRLSLDPTDTAPVPSKSSHKRRASGSEPRAADSGMSMRTPTKKQKRVRWSDAEPSPPSSGSSGLTPFVRRTTLSHKRSNTRATPAKRGRPRRSMPATPSRSLPTPPSSPFSSTRIMYVTPMKQEIEERQKRRLRRSHLSEVQNSADREMRNTKLQSRIEIQRLQSEIETLTFELEAQRQLGIRVDEEEEAREHNLREELATLKAQHDRQHEQTQTASPAPTVEKEDSDTIYDSGMFGEAANGDWENDNDDDAGMHMPSSPLGQRDASHSFGTPISFEGLQLPHAQIPTTSHAGTQAELQNAEHDLQLQTLRDTVNDLTRVSTDAQAALDTLRNTLNQLGFAPNEDSDEDISAVLLSTVRSIRISLEEILPGETICSTTDGRALLSEMLGHVRRLLDTNASSSRALEAQGASEVALRRQFNAALAEKAELTERIDVLLDHRHGLLRSIGQYEDEIERLKEQLLSRDTTVTQKDEEITHLTAASESQTTTIERLQSALNKYRDELKNLEGIIGVLEKDGAEKDVQVDQARQELTETKRTINERDAELKRLQDGIEEGQFFYDKLLRPGLENVTRRSKLGLAGDVSGPAEEQQC